MDRFSEIPKSECRVLAACHHQPLCGRGDVDVDVGGKDNVDAGDDGKNGDEYDVDYYDEQVDDCDDVENMIDSSLFLKR